MLEKNKKLADIFKSLWVFPKDETGFPIQGSVSSTGITNYVTGSYGYGSISSSYASTQQQISAYEQYQQLQTNQLIHTQLSAIKSY